MLNLTYQSKRMPALTTAHTEGFEWWYVDLVDAEGTGMVVIWGLRNPFLPVDYSGKMGPSVSVVIYERGEKTFSLHQVYENGEYHREGARWRIGDSMFQWRARGARGLLELSINCPIPGHAARLHASIRIKGVPCSAPERSGNPSALMWCPFLLRGTGIGRVSWGEGELTLHGRAYFDSNGSMEELGNLGMHSWCWGRLTNEGRTLVWFATEGEHPQQLFLDASDAHGIHTTSGAVTLDHGGWTRFGTRTLQGVDVRWGQDSVQVACHKPIENGPFYQRYLVSCHIHGALFEGVVEQVFIRRMNLPVWNQLVPMAIDQMADHRSYWLPFFSGSVRGRWRRLIRLFLGISWRGDP